ncbi:MAG: phosphopyruvate hydratase [Candidatus Woykebacteria bacterium RBG_16_43_9]|uniref:Enolase n=1 Tax=Candidatus Woykebacteria bacterium RBG_16_43_9 TaxID=1802596 RepID=A0A1G1WHM1_9BACT|nr:MAG: phosphopyruvate hydratase [Candidatus Woykebacteria bacterium RBG_16_43_9]
MAFITKIDCEEIIDSRGVPTLNTTVFLHDGSKGNASVPSGTSTGSSEAVELRDRDPNRYGGMGVLNAVNNVRGIIFQAIKSIDVSDQERVDNTMISLDRTANKSTLGANAILSVSLAVAAASAASEKIPLYEYIRQKAPFVREIEYQLPTLMVNIIEGGKHVDKGLDFQEFLAVPTGFRFFGESYANAKKLIGSLRNLIKQKKLELKLGMEGGFSLNLETNDEAIKLIKEAMEVIELYERGFGISLDIAANSLFKDGTYLVKDVNKPLYREEYIEFLVNFSKKHELFSIEDPLSENDLSGWATLNSKLAGKTLVIGDDLITTNQKKLNQALSYDTVNGVVVKPNQIGTLTETLNFIVQAKEAGLKIVISHRSGETLDTFISDLSVAVNADFIKIGSPAQKERSVKYNRLLEIEKELSEIR